MLPVRYSPPSPHSYTHTLRSSRRATINMPEGFPFRPCALFPSRPCALCLALVQPRQHDRCPITQPTDADLTHFGVETLSVLVGRQRRRRRCHGGEPSDRSGVDRSAEHEVSPGAFPRHGGSPLPHARQGIGAVTCWWFSLVLWLLVSVDWW